MAKCYHGFPPALAILQDPLDATLRLREDASPMPDTLIILVLALLALLVVLVLVLILRPARIDLSEIEAKIAAVEAGHFRIERALRDELAQGRTESTGQGRALREEVGGSVARLGDSLVKGIGQVVEAQNDRLDAFARSQALELQEIAAQLGTFSASNEWRMETLRQAVEERLRALQEDNAARLEQVRVTVDERLQGTLETRLGESCRAVSERLEQVHRGLGEMQALAHRPERLAEARFE